MTVSSRTARGSIAMLMATGVLLLGACAPGSDNADPTSAPTIAAQPTLAPGQSSVGTLLDQAQRAWAGIASARITYLSGPLGSAIERAPNRTIEEIVPPSSRRIVTVTNGAVSDEQVIVDGRIFMRGSFVAGAVAPDVGAAVWVTVDPSQVTGYTPVGQRIAYLTSPVTTPFGNVSTETRSLGATSTGAVQVDGRTCTVWTFGATTPEGIGYELALDESGLPCRFTQTAGGYANITLYEINVPDLRILPPDLATPVSGTPEG